MRTICSMKFTEYISTHQVFTTSSLMESMDSPSAAEEQLRLAVRTGKVERVRRGLLVSNQGRFEGVPVDPSAVVAALDGDAIVSYHSALELYGVAHNVSFSFRFRSDTTRRAFTFRGVAYEPVGHVGGVEWRFMRLAGVRTRVTTRYRTCGLQTTCPGVPTRSLARRPSPRARFSPAWSDRRGRARLPYRRPPA